jgi:hypothetical protein
VIEGIAWVDEANAGEARRFGKVRMERVTEARGFFRLAGTVTTAGEMFLDRTISGREPNVRKHPMKSHSTFFLRRSPLFFSLRLSRFFPIQSTAWPL